MSLDAAGTLITVAEPVGVTYARLAAAHGIEVSPAQLGEGFRAVYPRMPPLAFEGLAGDALVAAERDWWRMLVARVFGEAAATAPGFEPFFAAVYAHYAAADAWRVYPEVRAVLAELRARGLRLVVTSNFDTRLHGILAGLDLRVAFEAVVCSSEAGAAKPDAHVFAVACAAIWMASSRWGRPPIEKTGSFCPRTSVASPSMAAWRLPRRGPSRPLAAITGSWLSCRVLSRESAGASASTPISAS